MNIIYMMNFSKKPFYFKPYKHYRVYKKTFNATRLDAKFLTYYRSIKCGE